MVVLSQLGDLLFEVAYFVVQFLDQIFRFLLFSFGEMVLAEQAADLLLEVSYLPVFFVDVGGQLIVGSGEGIQPYECIVKILL